MKSYNDIAKEVLRRRDERLALAAKKRAAFVKTGSVVACFCVVAISGFFAVKNDYITRSVVDTQPPLNTVAPQNGDDPISAYVTDEKDTTDSDSISDTTTDPVSSDPQSESDDTTTDPITVIPPDTEPEPPVTDTPGTSEPPSTRPEPPETTDPPTSDTDPPVTTPGTSEPPSTEPEPPVTDPPVTEPPVTDPPVTDPPVTKPPVTDPPVTDPPVTDPPVTDPPVTDPPVTDPPVTDPPVTDPPVTDPPVTDPPTPPPSRPEDPYPPEFGGSGNTLQGVEAITKADLFYILYYFYARDVVKEERVFYDVDLGKWYSEPITWAAKSGIVYSVPENNGKYLDPFDYVKRQDLACYLYSLAGSPSTTGSIEAYVDFNDVSPYAVTAMTWCIDNKVLTPSYNRKLNPLEVVYLSVFEKNIFLAFKRVVD